MQLMDLPPIRNSAPLRKASAFALKAPRMLRRWTSPDSDYANFPPVLVNSVPKSGTHLLMQIARALPGTRYYGSFIAQQPSVTLRTRSADEICTLIGRLAPAEVAGAHLHHSETTAAALRDRNVLHLMIIRDPLDVLQSEAHYLAEMNRFHRMAREFAGLPTPERLELALNGSAQIPDRYPQFLDRIQPYAAGSMIRTPVS